MTIANNDNVRGSRHVRTSAGTSEGVRNPNSVGSTVLPFLAMASEKIKNISDGKRPRAFQLLTAESPTPESAAVAVTPPNASMTASIVVSMMDPEYSRFVNKSSVHGMEIVTACELALNSGMSRSLKDVANRLEMTRKALGLSAADLCKDSGISPNQWTQFTNAEKYKRRISIASIYKLKDAFGITFEWVLDGDPHRLPHELAQKLRKAA